jgi:hypothetical protein
MIAQNRRARTVSAANKAHNVSTGRNLNRSLTRLRMQVMGEDAVNSANPLSPTILSHTIQETYATFIASPFSSIFRYN